MWIMRTWTFHMQGRKEGLNSLFLENLPNGKQWDYSGLAEWVSSLWWTPKQPLLLVCSWIWIWTQSCGWKYSVQAAKTTDSHKNLEKKESPGWKYHKMVTLISQKSHAFFVVVIPIKGIVHFEMNFWCFSLPQGHPKM